MKINYISILVLLIISLSSCSSDDDAISTDLTAASPGELAITFDNQVGDTDFVLNQEFTVNSQTVTLNQLRYWVSNVSLINDQGEVIVIDDSYFLIEETDAISIQDGAYEYPATKRETITLSGVPAGNYTGISYAIGIDSKYNDNLSLQAGELSQLNGMTNISWMWHTSYIFTAIKGKIVNSESVLKLETGLNDSYRELTLNFDQALVVNASDTSDLRIKADITGMLQGVDFTETPAIGASTPEAMNLMADNFQNATFSLEKATDENL